MRNIKQLVRVLLQHKRTTLFLIVSLSIGLTAYIMISAKVMFHKSYDTYLPEYRNIYRIVSSTYADNVLTISQPRVQRVLGELLVEKQPGVKQSAYLCRTMENHYKTGDLSFRNEHSFHCSPGFVSFFSPDVLEGKSTDLLTRPNMAMISESFAKRYFGDENPVGKTIQQYPGGQFEIEAVYRDFPKNSHLRPEILISFHDQMHLPPPLKENWGEFAFYTYLQLDEKTDVKKLEGRITELYRENNPLTGQGNLKYTYRLQPVHEIHTQSHLKNEIGENIRGDYLRILQLISIFILVVSGFNYVYFSFTRISVNFAQYGIRKALGAKNSFLLWQFISESLLVHFMALAISFIAIYFLQTIPHFGDLLPFGILPVKFWLILGIAFLFSSLVNPLILLLFLHDASSLRLLSKKMENFPHGFSFRKLFTIVQFVIIIFLISSILGIHKQVNFLKEKDKGFTIEDKLVINTPRNLMKNSARVNNPDAFEQEIEKMPGVESVSVSNNVPGDIPTFAFSASEQRDVEGMNTALFIADDHFLRTFGIDLLQGNNFDESHGEGCIVNTVFMKQLGYKKPGEILGKTFYLQDESKMQTVEARVIGVCEDFNFTSAKETPNPVVFLDWTRDFMWGKYTVAVHSNIDKSALLTSVEDHFYRTFPNYPFEYFWLEDFYNKQFDQENAIIGSLKNFALVAMILGILSLLSMVWHISVIRTKEIGIRKVNGAKRADIIKILNFDFVQWIGIAALIAIPLSWYFLSDWLNSFAYRTGISFWIFVLSSATAFLVGMITVTLQSLRVAGMNPVESIKYE